MLDSAEAKDVRARIEAGMNVRIGPLATCAGLSHQAVRLAISRGEIRAVRLAIMIPPDEGARVLGMEAARTAVAA